MLTAEGCLTRRHRLWNTLPEHIEWVLIADPRHVNYLSAFWVHPLSFAGGEHGLLLLERSGKATLLAENFARASTASDPFVDDEIIETWYDHQHSVINRDEALFNAVKIAADRVRGRPGAIESEALPVSAAVAINSDGLASGYGLGTILRTLRRNKQQDEVELLRRCMRGGEAGQARALEIVEPGVSELNVFREVQSASVAGAGEPVLVYGDFRATNAETPKNGGLPSDRVLQQGDLLILDFSVVLNGYRSDFTNTLAVGDPTEEQQSLFAMCEQGLAAGAEALKAGAAARSIHTAASAPFVEAGRVPIPHHAGHGIGLAHPEPPILVPQSDDTLEAGDVVTLEPGAYQSGVGGIRIERNYLITPTGSECLSDHRIALRL